MERWIFLLDKTDINPLCTRFFYYLCSHKFFQLTLMACLPGCSGPATSCKVMRLFTRLTTGDNINSPISTDLTRKPPREPRKIINSALFFASLLQEIRKHLGEALYYETKEDVLSNFLATDPP